MRESEKERAGVTRTHIHKQREKEKERETLTKAEREGVKGCMWTKEDAHLIRAETIGGAGK